MEALQGAAGLADGDAVPSQGGRIAKGRAIVQQRDRDLARASEGTRTPAV